MPEKTTGGPIPEVPSAAAIKRLLHESGLAPRHRLGQNFLIDSSVLTGILRAADLSAADVALEIGAGLGVLTRGLARKAGRVLALELDPGLLAVLRQRLADVGNVDLVQGDALKADLSALVGGNQPPAPGRVKVVANLPYYITTPFLMRLLEEVEGWERAVLMVQREVADRLLASPGGKSYGMLSLAVRYYARSEMVAPVSRKSFWPAPEVDSAVVRLWRREAPPVEAPQDVLFAAIKAAFAQRRKTLSNALGARWPREKVLEALAKAEVDPQRRGETLSLEEFATLARALSHEA